MSDLRNRAFAQGKNTVIHEFFHVEIVGLNGTFPPSCHGRCNMQKNKVLPGNSGVLVAATDDELVVLGWFAGQDVVGVEHF